VLENAVSLDRYQFPEVADSRMASDRNKTADQVFSSKRYVDQSGTSWNRVAAWLRKLESLRRVGWRRRLAPY